MTVTKLHTRYVSHTVSDGKEFFSLSVMRDEGEYQSEYYFNIGGVGVKDEPTGHTLRDVKKEIEKSIQVSEGRFTQDRIDEDTPMVSAHHDKVVDFIDSQIDEYGEYTTALEWLKQVN